MTKPFSEVGRFEQGNVLDPFYTTGSAGSTGENPGSFSRSLFGKEQIKASFGVKIKTSMLPNSCSIYYFNKVSGEWSIPSRALGDHVGPFDKFAIGTVWSPASGSTGAGFTRGSTVIEDAKCFDAYGRLVSSGSLDINRQVTESDDRGLGNSNGSSKYIGSSVSGNRFVDYQFRRGASVIEALLEDFPKSVQRSQLYDATDNETFELNIDRPFLMEKAVFEIPFCLGQTWFQDRTVTTLAAATGTYTPTNTPINLYTHADSGGPALTVSLFCQKKYGQENIRDLIAKGTITHFDDSKLTAIARRLPLGLVERGAYGVAVEPYGIRNPNAVVYQSAPNSPFTGSVAVKTTASISNGVNASSIGIWFMTSSLPNAAVDAYKQPGYEVYYLREVLSKYAELIKFPEDYGKTKLTLSSFAQLGVSLASSLDTFGRGMTGFSPSGGSIFGGEYATSQAFSKTGDPIILNPYYSDNSTVTERAAAFNKLDIFFNQLDIDMQSYVPNYNGVPANTSYPGTFTPQAWIYNIYPAEVFTTSKDSPYLLNPGDKLVLAISKTRPAISASGHDIKSAADVNIGKSVLTKLIPVTGSVSGHDVTLNTGSINMTFYGSYVRAGDSYTP